MARTVSECFGGRVTKENRYLFHVRGTCLGDFTIELDALLFRELKVRDYFKKLGAGDLAADLEELAAGVAETVVPWEVVSEPVPYPQLPEFDRLRLAIWKAGGERTGAFPLYAFGLHLNPEVPDTDTLTFLSFLRALILLHDYLAEAMEQDLTRALSPFVAPFPEDYAGMILTPEYSPDRDTSVRDYIRHNDRNRETRLASIIGPGAARVNSLHKQAVDRIGTEIKVAAREGNGVVQAIKGPGDHFLLGVQWHPEYLPQIRRQQRLFRALVEAATRFRTGA
jgi:hypothetical protein